MDELAARVFLRTDRSREDVEALIVNILRGELRDGVIVADPAEIEVLDNDDYSSEKLRDDPTDFIYFPLTIEIYVGAEADKIRCIQPVGLLMTALNEAGAAVVVASDWEDQLPGAGKLGL